MVKVWVHQLKDNRRGAFVAPLMLSGFKLWRLLLVAAIKQLFGTYIFSIGAAAVLGRKHPIPHTAGGQQGRKRQQEECQTNRFHNKGFRE
jgi:hypothetical protein